MDIFIRRVVMVKETIADTKKKRNDKTPRPK